MINTITYIPKVLSKLQSFMLLPVYLTQGNSSRKIRDNRGITLVELLIAAFILVVGFCGVLMTYINSMHSTQSSWEITTASSHAQYILEEMQSKESLFDITAINWDEWAHQHDILTLPKESIDVSYEDRLANPLGITVTIKWKNNFGEKNIVLSTKLSK